MSNSQSVLDVILNSASVAGRKTYLHRMVYIGEHTHPLLGRDNIVNIFERGIRKINESNRDEALTGFLLAYATQFIHVLEGSEESLLRHTESFVEANDKDEQGSDEPSADNKIGRTKIIIVYHHVHQRALTGWMGAPAKPLRRLARIGQQEDPGVHVASCLAKLSRLLQHFRLQPAEGVRSALRHMTAQVAEMLPEASLLEFVLGVTMLPSLQQYSSNARQFLQHTLFYREQTWPVPCDHVPYSMFLKPSRDNAVVKPKLTS